MNNKSQEIVEIVSDVLNTTEDYVENAIPLIDKLSMEFYNIPNKDAWEQLIDLFGGISWIIETLTEIDSIKTMDRVIDEYRLWNEYVQIVLGLNPIVSKLEVALEGKDYTLVGGLLSQNIIPIFKSILEKLNILNGSLKPGYN